MPEADDLRARAARCRDVARQYPSDVGESLIELAVELDKRADALEIKEEMRPPPTLFRG